MTTATFSVEIDGAMTRAISIPDGVDGSFAGTGAMNVSAAEVSRDEGGSNASNQDVGLDSRSRSFRCTVFLLRVAASPSTVKASLCSDGRSEAAAMLGCR
jgi:hypothetical protein